MTNMEKMDKEPDVVLSVALLLITVTCLGISFWSMMGGYENLVGNIFASAALSFIIVLMLFALNYHLRRSLMMGISGARVTVIFIIYMIVVAISFSGLFNKFYSTFMHTELITEELAIKIDKITELKNKAIASLSSEDAIILQSKVKTEVEKLKNQISNPGNKGSGALAEGILKEIEDLLGSKITRLHARNSTSEALKELGEQYEKMILGENGVLDGSEKLAELNTSEKRAYLKEIPILLDKQINAMSEKRIKLGNSDDSTLRSNAIASLQEAVQVANSVCKKTESLQKDGKFKCGEPMTVKNEQIGKISHTYQSAGEHFSHFGVWLSIILALAIDLIVPIFVFVLTPRGQQLSGSKRGKNSPQILKNEF